MESKSVFLSTPTSIRSLDTIGEEYVRILSSERLFKHPDKRVSLEDISTSYYQPSGKGGKRKAVKSKRRKAVLKAHRK